MSRNLPGHLTAVEGDPLTDPEVVVAGWSPEPSDDPMLEVGRYVLIGGSWILDSRPGVCMNEGAARQLAAIGTRLTPPASAMLLAMCEAQLDQLWDHHYDGSESGRIALLQACRDLDSIADFLGTDRPASYAELVAHHRMLKR